MINLAAGNCVPCRGGEPPLSEAEIEDLLFHVPQWRVEQHSGIPHLERTFKFKNFAEALDFTNEVGSIAEKEDHHPMLVTEWGKVTVHWWTHVVKGLHKNDFIMAAKTDEVYG
jgi:4a-hydroxytetrahydrobiopterin dehydratase